ncbi:unnamed protein product [Sphagnum jensenii]|uniref:Uncharacterized protein n=1 Tax=Sphagnum jensenii TaxID=128206 RepID=A0ABP1BR68_9BRYO
MGTTQYENRRQNKMTGAAAAQRRRVQECGGALLFLLRLSRDALQQQQASQGFAKFAPTLYRLNWRNPPHAHILQIDCRRMRDTLFRKPYSG